MRRPDAAWRYPHTIPHLAAVLATIVVMAFAFLLASNAGRGPNFNPDESRWISRAHFLTDLADPFGPTWADGYTTRGQPPLGSYVTGLGLLVQGRDVTTNRPWDFFLPWEENIALGHKPVPEDLDAARRTSAALMAMTSLALVVVARTFVTTPWAIGAGALFAVHPFTAYVGSLATSDAVFGFLVALAAVAAAAFARRPGLPRAVLLGAVLGLGGATKLSPLVLATSLAAAGLAALAIFATGQRRVARPQAIYALSGVVVGIAAMVTFVVAYPYLWSDPVTRTHHLFAFRAEEMAAQADDWPIMAVPTRIEALRRVGVNFSERYNLSASVITWFSSGSAPLAVRQLELLLPVVGAAIMVVMAARAGPYSPPMLALTVLGGQVLITILGMRSEFDRYHVPMALLGAVASAVALRWLAGLVAPLFASMPRQDNGGMLRNEASRLVPRAFAMHEILRPRAQHDTTAVSRNHGHHHPD